MVEITAEDVLESKFLITANMIKTKCTTQASKTLLVNIVDAKTNNSNTLNKSESNVFINIILEYPF